MTDSLRPFLSVVIPTYNRARILRDTLESLTQLDSPDRPWEVVVVDNNSTDNTPAVVSEFEARLPVRRVFEGKQGVAAAMNRGFDEAQGQVVMIIGDDISPSPGWFKEFTREIDAHPEVMIFGGPYFEKIVGQVPDYTEAVVTGTCYFGGGAPRPDTGPYPQGELPAGANVAFRRPLFENPDYRFDEGFGPTGKGRVSGGDRVLFERAVRNNIPMLYISPAVVYHRWYPPQFGLKRLCRRAYGIGRGEARLRPPAVPRILGVPRYMMSTSVICAWGILVGLVRGDPVKWRRSLLILMRYLGGMKEAFHYWRGRTPPAPPQAPGDAGTSGGAV